ncbi:hypothetical protein BDV93DRAFT_216052 [Ceratobasidium sp. AG-I]|nr:hypothetical protein BDV93DRAFT_216052 [Ceratobasidium sp. AG-I]
MAAMEQNSRVVPVVDMNPPVISSDVEMDKDDGPQFAGNVLDGERSKGVTDASGPSENSAPDPRAHERLIVDSAGNLSSQMTEELTLPDFTNLSVSALLGIPVSSSDNLFFSPLGAGLVPSLSTQTIPPPPFDYTSGYTIASIPNGTSPPRRTPWMPDFTFGPTSELIDICAFLKSVEESIQPQSGQETVWELRPEGVAGWEDLQALNKDARQALVDECRTSDLLGTLTEVTSDPARLALVREIHNQATLAALGHTTESIKLPPEKRDRKRKKGGKAGGGARREEGQKAGDISRGTTEGADNGHAAEDTGAMTTIEDHPAEAHVERDLSGVEDVVMTGVGSAENGTTAAAGFALPSVPAGGGKTRKGKGRAEPEEVTPDLGLLELSNTLKGLGLNSWLLPDTGKHFIRKPRSSDVNVLPDVRPSTIPFTLPVEPRNDPSRSPSPSATHVWGPILQTPLAQRPHALIELSILTPAAHPPHTPRHTLSLALLNSQTLEDISEALICANRWVPRSMGDSDGTTSGACMVIEGVVYGDGDGDTNGKDYADKLIEYLSLLKAQSDAPAGLGKKDREAIMVLDEQLNIGLPMLSTSIDSVKWKLHKPYWFMHDGGCVHWIVVSSISLLHAQDPPLPTPGKTSNWPYVTSLSPLPHRGLCRVCSRVPAILAVSGDVRLGESPSLVCEGCWALLGPPKAGRDFSGEGTLTLLPLVSPDGL